MDHRTALWPKRRRFDTTEEIYTESQEVIDTLTTSRRRWKLGVTVRNFSFMVKFPEVLGSTTCIQGIA
jgi:hypothetical protein